MNKIKIFTDLNSDQVEASVNNWAQKIRGEIIRIEYSTAVTSILRHSVLIHYKTPKK